MKNIEQILKDAGIEPTEDQLEKINSGIAENYKTIADYTKQAKKLATAEENVTALQSQLSETKEALKGFDGVDIEGFKSKIAELEEKAVKAEKDAATQILKRDQKDYLKAEFDKLGIKSERTRKSLMAEIMDEENGLKWKNNAFMGLADYLAQENEKDHFYETQEERDAKAAQAEAEAKRVKEARLFTQPMGNQKTPEEPDDTPSFNFGFTPIREVKQ